MKSVTVAAALGLLLFTGSVPAGADEPSGAAATAPADALFKAGQFAEADNWGASSRTRSSGRSP